jgi:hypothetical protein
MPAAEGCQSAIGAPPFGKLSRLPDACRTIGRGRTCLVAAIRIRTNSTYRPSWPVRRSSLCVAPRPRFRSAVAVARCSCNANARLARPTHVSCPKVLAAWAAGTETIPAQQLECRECFLSRLPMSGRVPQVAFCDSTRCPKVWRRGTACSITPSRNPLESCGLHASSQRANPIGSC